VYKCLVKRSWLNISIVWFGVWPREVCRWCRARMWSPAGTIPFVMVQARANLTAIIRFDRGLRGGNAVDLPRLPTDGPQKLLFGSTLRGSPGECRVKTCWRRENYAQNDFTNNPTCSVSANIHAWSIPTHNQATVV